MSPKDQIRRIEDSFDSRSMAEKCLIGLLLVVLVVWAFNALYLTPRRDANTALSRQITAAGSQLAVMQQRERQAEISATQDPNQAARQRIERAIAAQAELQGDIEQLAGNLVTPQSMTRLLTSILESQSGLELVKVENRDPQPMRQTSPGAATDQNRDISEEVDGLATGQQVFKHSLMLDLEGDYLSLILYLQRIEGFSERFFWDQITFARTEWPVGTIRLEIHTLSTEEGFVGV
ncbi:hypothetical protein PHACT_06900 [Pseudohongiella acticola]|uniref:MSHA biogenesis protein MshJ n=1 Tax=Pseudohongiella acticola TaxID=1524254 RepID=A0A1E8CKH7_9GAMM|nr:hypothetical protein [Pseudohongiella acticola]OFE12903.1 hypothetical protein PHACT_06900 [Pseudohongiella acticola]